MRRRARLTEDAAPVTWAGAAAQGLEAAAPSATRSTSACAPWPEELAPASEPA
jgi:hypothetical protein